MNQVNETVAVVVPSLSQDVADAVKDQAISLNLADRSYENAVLDVARAVAAIMQPDMNVPATFDHWTLVQSAFIADYAAARECKEETARKRWSAVAVAMESNFGQEKPAKPSRAAEVKAKQRGDAETQALALIEANEATTPQAILSLAQASEDGTTPAQAVVAALGKIATERAKEAGKASSDAAREEVKTLRENIRKGLGNLSLAQLREVAELVAGYQPVVVAEAEAVEAE